MINKVLYLYIYIYVSTLQSGSSSGLLIDLPTNEKQVHADFYNDFEDLFDDDDDVPVNTSG